MKGRKHKNTGGENEAEADVKTKPENRSNTGEKEEGVANEAEEMKKGGRAKKRHKKAHGGGFGPEKHGTDEPKVMGDKPLNHAGRKPRKAGGRASSNANPFTSARMGKDAPGRKLMRGEPGASGED
jgi:hypothetical protein